LATTSAVPPGLRRTLVGTPPLQPVPVSLGDFQTLRNNGSVYVDKTLYLHKLVTETDRKIFLSRPRKFGKSLAVTALKAMFGGPDKARLFDGTVGGSRLALADAGWDWAP
jgi:hypothetical protein